jgi:hypothetical protein
MAIDSLQAIPASDAKQWIRIRGASASNPVLLLIQQGPGLPMINEARRLEHLLGLEQHFTVIYWDQRGCGRSLRGQHNPEDITLKAMVADTVSLLEYLQDRFGNKTCIHQPGRLVDALRRRRLPVYRVERPRPRRHSLTLGRDRLQPWAGWACGGSSSLSSLVQMT